MLGQKGFRGQPSPSQATDHLPTAKASVKTLDRIREESKQQEIYIYTQEFKIYSSFQSVE